MKHAIKTFLTLPTCCIVLSLGLSGSALADFTDTEAALFLNSGSRTGIGGGTYTLGYTFTLNTPRTLTHLGLYSYNNEDSANADRRIGVWDSAGTLLADLTVPVGGGEIDTPGVGKFIYGTLPAPVDLLDGELYTAGVWYSVDNSPGLAFEVDFSTIPDFNYGDTVLASSSGALIKPTIVRTPERPNGYIGPNLRFSTTIFPGPSLSLEIESSGEDLIFTWDSRFGRVYDLLSATDLTTLPETWTPWKSDLAATPEQNIETYARPGDAMRFFALLEKDAPPIFSDDFESGQGNWTTGSVGAAGTVWELGNPAGGAATGPPAAASPVTCFGTNISADYELNADVWLRSPSIDLTDPRIGRASLSFQQFRDNEATFDFGSVRVLKAADNTQLGADVLSGIDGTSVDWETTKAALPAEAIGELIKLEFRFTSDEENDPVLGTQAGWYIDDVTVSVR